MTASQSQTEYHRARDVMLRLRTVGSDEARSLVCMLSEALGDPTGDSYAAMVALTLNGEAMLRDH